MISHLFLDNPYELVDFGSHPSAVVGGCVNVVSGDYVVNQEDLVIRGHEPIPIQRRYFMRDDGDYYGGWNCGFNHLKATVTNRYHLQLPEKIGVKLEYSINSKEARERILKNKKAYFTLQDPEGAITNSALGELSARNNPTNNVVYYKAGDQKEILVKGPDGSTRHYRTFSSMAEILLSLPGQDVWIYYYLRREVFPNGNVMVYSWEEHGKQRILSKVETKDRGGNLLAWAKFTHDPSDCKRLKWTHIETSDGRTLTYYFDSKFEHRGRKYSLLKEVRHSDQPSEHYEPYWKTEFEEVGLAWVKFPDERFRNIHHYCVGSNKGTGVKITKEEALEHAHYKRVKFLFEPVGEDKRLHQVYKFLYEPGEYKKKAGHTDVYDAYGNRTRYHYTGKYWLSAVLHYKGEAELFSQDLYHWSTKGWLRSKVLTGSKGDPLSATIYDYDSKGNVIIESFYGNLTGDESKHVRCIGSHFPIVDQAECFRVKRTYTEKNLLHVETFPNGMKIENVYLEDTDLLSAKYIYEGSEIVRRHFYTYEGSILIQQIVDDGRGREAAHLEGVTQRLIQTITPRKGQPFYGFPEEIEEAYLDLEKGMPILLKKQKIQYNSKGLVEKIDHWDAQGVYRYTLEYLYDARGRLEKQKDPIGRWRTLEYDANDNPIQEHDPNENFFIKNTYDFSNRPTVSSKIGVSGAKERVESQYNFLHQKISETNEQGNKTHYVHDPFGNLLVKTLPAIADETDTLRCPELRNTYNAQG
ncbi:MAG: RHS repeat protein, partial [Chlamydiia bacterium]|nr:RHS repeat protein [Chlamydiia bacterium]